MKIGDFILVILLLFLSIIIFINNQRAQNFNTVTIINYKNQKFYYPLNYNGVVNIKGPLGETLIEIKQKRVKIISSPCHCKLCIKMGAINSGGQSIVCLPNKVFVSLEKEKSEVDAICR